MKFFFNERIQKFENLKKIIFFLNENFLQIKKEIIRTKYYKMFFTSKILGYIYYLLYIKGVEKQFYYNNFDFYFIYKGLLSKEYFYNLFIDMINIFIVEFNSFIKLEYVNYLEQLLSIAYEMYQFKFIGKEMQMFSQSLYNEYKDRLSFHMMELKLSYCSYLFYKIRGKQRQGLRLLNEILQKTQKDRAEFFSLHIKYKIFTDYFDLKEESNLENWTAKSFFKEFVNYKKRGKLVKHYIKHEKKIFDFQSLFQMLEHITEVNLNFGNLDIGFDLCLELLRVLSTNKLFHTINNSRSEKTKLKYTLTLNYNFLSNLFIFIQIMMNRKQKGNLIIKYLTQFVFILQNSHKLVFAYFNKKDQKFLPFYNFDNKKQEFEQLIKNMEQKFHQLKLYMNKQKQKFVNQFDILQNYLPTIDNFNEATFSQTLEKFECKADNHISLNYEYMGMQDKDYIGLYILNFMYLSKKDAQESERDQQKYFQLSKLQKIKLYKSFFNIRYDKNYIDEIFKVNIYNKLFKNKQSLIGENFEKNLNLISICLNNPQMNITPNKIHFQNKNQQNINCEILQLEQNIKTKIFQKEKNLFLKLQQIKNFCVKKEEIDFLQKNQNLFFGLSEPVQYSNFIKLKNKKENNQQIENAKHQGTFIIEQIKYRITQTGVMAKNINHIINEFNKFRFDQIRPSVIKVDILQNVQQIQQQNTDCLAIGFLIKPNIFNNQEKIKTLEKYENLHQINSKKFIDRQNIFNQRQMYFVNKDKNKQKSKFITNIPQNVGTLKNFTFFKHSYQKMRIEFIIKENFNNQSMYFKISPTFLDNRNFLIKFIDLNSFKTHTIPEICIQTEFARDFKDVIIRFEEDNENKYNSVFPIICQHFINEFIQQIFYMNTERTQLEGDVKSSYLQYLGLSHPIMYNNFTFQKNLFKNSFKNLNDLYLYDFDSIQTFTYILRIFVNFLNFFQIRKFIGIVNKRINLKDLVKIDKSIIQTLYFKNQQIQKFLRKIKIVNDIKIEKQQTFKGTLFKPGQLGFFLQQFQLNCSALMESFFAQIEAMKQYHKLRNQDNTYYTEAIYQQIIRRKNKFYLFQLDHKLHFKVLNGLKSQINNCIKQLNELTMIVLETNDEIIQEQFYKMQVAFYYKTLEFIYKKQINLFSLHNVKIRNENEFYNRKEINYQNFYNFNHSNVLQNINFIDYLSGYFQLYIKSFNPIIAYHQIDNEMIENIIFRKNFFISILEKFVNIDMNICQQWNEFIPILQNIISNLRVQKIKKYAYVKSDLMKMSKDDNFSSCQFVFKRDELMILLKDKINQVLNNSLQMNQLNGFLRKDINIETLIKDMQAIFNEDEIKPQDNEISTQEQNQQKQKEGFKLQKQKNFSNLNKFFHKKLQKVQKEIKGPEIKNFDQKEQKQQDLNNLEYQNLQKVLGKKDIKRESMLLRQMKKFSNMESHSTLQHASFKNFKSSSLMYSGKSIEINQHNGITKIEVVYEETPPKKQMLNFSQTLEIDKNIHLINEDQSPFINRQRRDYPKLQSLQIEEIANFQGSKIKINCIQRIFERVKFQIYSPKYQNNYFVFLIYDNHKLKFVLQIKKGEFQKQLLRKSRFLKFFLLTLKKQIFKFPLGLKLVKVPLLEFAYQQEQKEKYKQEPFYVDIKNNHQGIEGLHPYLIHLICLDQNFNKRDFLKDMYDYRVIYLTCNFKKNFNTIVEVFATKKQIMLFITYIAHKIYNAKKTFKTLQLSARFGRNFHVQAFESVNKKNQNITDSSNLLIQESKEMFKRNKYEQSPLSFKFSFFEIDQKFKKSFLCFNWQDLLKFVDYSLLYKKISNITFNLSENEFIHYFLNKQNEILLTLLEQVISQIQLIDNYPYKNYVLVYKNRHFSNNKIFIEKKSNCFVVENHYIRKLIFRRVQLICGEFGLVSFYQHNFNYSLIIVVYFFASFEQVVFFPKKFQIKKLMRIFAKEKDISISKLKKIILCKKIPKSNPIILQFLLQMIKNFLINEKGELMLEIMGILIKKKYYLFSKCYQQVDHTKFFFDIYVNRGMACLRGEDTSKINLFKKTQFHIQITQINSKQKYTYKMLKQSINYAIAENPKKKNYLQQKELFKSDLMEIGQFFFKKQFNYQD